MDTVSSARKWGMFAILMIAGQDDGPLRGRSTVRPVASKMALGCHIGTVIYKNFYSHTLSAVTFLARPTEKESQPFDVTWRCVQHLPRMTTRCHSL